MSNVIWTTCSKCSSKAERGFARDYCTNSECEFFDRETYIRASAAKPVPTIFASRSDGPPTWDENTPLIWPCAPPIDPPSKLTFDEELEDCAGVCEWSVGATFLRTPITIEQLIKKAEG